MEINKFKEDLMSLKQALAKIKVNNKSSYEWYPVKTKQGCYIELGGNNFKGNLVVKAYICSVINNELEVGSNNYIKTKFSISLDEGISYPSYYLPSPLKTNEELLNWLDNKEGLNELEFEVIPVYRKVLDGYRLSNNDCFNL